MIARLGRILLCLWITQAFAGQTCEQREPTPESMRNAFSLGLRVRDALDRSGASVALVARVGQDLSRYRLRYSHVGFVVRDHPAGKWLVVHLLNDCGTAHSAIYNQGLANFFADDMFAWEAMIVVPSPPTQERLQARITGTAALRLHEPKYNMLAYPFASLYQNSNQWLLEILAEAYADGEFATRAESTAWLRANDFRPTTLDIPAMTRLGARMFRANVAFDDHPTDRRMAGKIDTTTVDSVTAFLALREGKVTTVIERLPGVRAPNT